MRWFRQDEPITLDQQIGFIEYDLLYNKYYGCIVEVKGKPVGVSNLKNTGEFGLAILPQYQNKGYEEQVVCQLPKGCWSEVFLGDPRIKLYLNNYFEIVDVREREYWKKGLGLIDTIKVEKMKDSNVQQTNRRKMS